MNPGHHSMLSGSLLEQQILQFLSPPICLVMHPPSPRTVSQIHTSIPTSKPMWMLRSCRFPKNRFLLSGQNGQLPSMVPTRHSATIQ